MLALQPATAVRDQPTMRLLGLPCRLVDTGKLTCHLRVFDPDRTMTGRSLQPVRMLVRDFGAWRSGSKLQPLSLTFQAISVVTVGVALLIEEFVVASRRSCGEPDMNVGGNIRNLLQLGGLRAVLLVSAGNCRRMQRGFAGAHCLLQDVSIPVATWPSPSKKHWRFGREAVFLPRNPGSSTASAELPHGYTAAVTVGFW